MDKPTKQNVLLAVLAVLVLGAGGSFYWFSIRDAGGGAKEDATATRVERKERVSTGERKLKRKAARKEKDRQKVAGVTRKERKEADRAKIKRKERGRGKKAKVKKKKEAPAA